MDRACRALGGAAALACALALAPAASAAPADYTTIRNDFRSDGKLTRCRFSAAELGAARTIVAGSPDEAYGSFASALDGEIARVKAKFCQGVVPQSARAKSALKVVVKSLSAKGKAKDERVTLRNTSSKTVSLGGATLRNRNGKRVSLKGIKLEARKSVTVYIGCGTAKAGRAYVCSKNALLADKGDVLRLADGKGVVAGQRGFGRYAGVYRF